MQEQIEKPATDDREAWEQYWANSQPSEWYKIWGYWRTEPEISSERQEYLSKRWAIEPNVELGIYPFKDISLDRADIEWLLANLNSGNLHGPINWTDEIHRSREGLDLRGANLHGTDLQYLPLAALRAGLASDIITELDADFYLRLYHPYSYAKENRPNTAKSPSELAEEVDRKMNSASADFGQANLIGTHLEGAELSVANFEDAVLFQAHLDDASLVYTNLIHANLVFAHLENADLRYAHLNSSYCYQAHLEKANLKLAIMAEADLTEAHLEGASLIGAKLGGIRTKEETYNPAILQGAYFDSTTQLRDLDLGTKRDGYALLADLHWGNANIGVVDWNKVSFVGEERFAVDPINARDEARDDIEMIGESLRHETGIRLPSWVKRILAFFQYISFERGYAKTRSRKVALRATRQLAVELRNQGLYEEADRFSYRSHSLQRKVYRLEEEFFRYLGSSLLNIIAGYGYKPLRSIITYVLTILGFAALYFEATNYPSNLSLTTHSTPLAWNEALVLSISSFHGRGFFPSALTLSDPIAFISAAEAIIGLLIEIIFIATFTQRFFGK